MSRIDRHIGRRERALWVALFVGLSTGGCVAVAAPRFYGTTTISPMPALSTEPPNRGRTIAVRVEDKRRNVSGYEVGAKRSGTWGFEASTIDLKGRALLATQIANDVVAIVRQMGHRAVPEGDTRLGPSELVLTVHILVFRLEAVPEASWMGGDALVSFECLMADSGRRVTLDAVGVRRIAPKGGAFGFEDADYQKHFEALYSSLRERLRERLVEDLPAA